MWITEAHAQAAEATKVATGAADVYLNQGVLGATCLIFILLFLGACWVIRAQDRKIDKLQGVALADRDRLLGTINDSEKSLNELASAMKGVQHTLEARGQTVGDLSHQLALQNTEVSHKLANLSQALKMIAGAIRRRVGGDSVEEDA